MKKRLALGLLFVVGLLWGGSAALARTVICQGLTRPGGRHGNCLVVCQVTVCEIEMPDGSVVEVVSQDYCYESCV